MSAPFEIENGPVNLRMPRFVNLFQLRVIVPILIYFGLFRYASRYVKKNCWLSFKGFKRYRLQNLTICFMHACLSGTLDLLHMIYHRDKIYSEEVIHWWNPIVAQIPLMSIGYFIHDGLDMLSYEWSKWTLELLIHHVLTCIALITPFFDQKFLLANSWALLMEANSIFLHARTILQMTSLSKSFPHVYNGVVMSNILSFFLFRIVSQLIFCTWVLRFFSQMHWYYILIGLGGCTSFCVINSMLFVRILAADNLLPESLAARFKVNRDQEDNDKREPKAIEDVKKDE